MIDELKLQLVSIAIGCFQPLSAAAALYKSGFRKQVDAYLVVSGNGAVQLVQMQKPEAIVDNQT